jgi:hypothetical protein
MLQVLNIFFFTIHNARRDIHQKWIEKMKGNITKITNAQQYNENIINWFENGSPTSGKVILWQNWQKIWRFLLLFKYSIIQRSVMKFYQFWFFEHFSINIEKTILNNFRKSIYWKKDHDIGEHERLYSYWLSWNPFMLSETIYPWLLRIPEYKSLLRITKTLVINSIFYSIVLYYSLQWFTVSPSEKGYQTLNLVRSDSLIRF